MVAAGKRIDHLVDGLDDWRGATLARVRQLIHEAVPDVEEEWKWMGSPVWSRDGIIAVGNAHRAKVKLTFPHGAQLDDPKGVFNNGFGGKHWRAIDLAEGDRLNATDFKALVRRAVKYNAQLAAAKEGAAKRPTKRAGKRPAKKAAE